MLTAALLCSFSIPESGRNFLAYSLNESIDDQNLRVYLALLFNEGGNYRIGALDSDADSHLAIKVFSQILREAATGEHRDSDVAYHLVDLNKKPLAPAAAADHRMLSVKKEWVAKLLNFQSSAQYGPAVEYSPMLVVIDDDTLSAAMAQGSEAEAPTSQQQPQTPPEEVRYSDLGAVPAAPVKTPPVEPQHEDWPFPGTDPVQFLQDIEASLLEFSGIAQKLTQQKQQSQAQLETLGSKERQLQEKEQQIEQKEEQLLKLQEQLHQAQKSDSLMQARQEARQAELKAREEVLQRKTTEMAEHFEKLSHARDNFNNILKSLNDIIPLGESVLSE
ncbi:V-type proton ATPase subunit E [Pseudomonas chlororaphis]|nr:V-type proton ATPase subunit E [Pseudomonas chlororaphis]